MDAFCAPMRASVHPVAVSKGFGYGDSGLWGEKIRGSLKNRGCRIKTERHEGMAKKVNPGVTCSILTHDINKQHLVCRFIYTVIH